ncbi:MAG: peptidylprolyl isomerase [Polyangiales bacterium]
MQSLAARFQTIVLIGLVTLLSLVFVLQFGGPQAEGCTSGGSSYAARVDGDTISGGDFTAAYILAGFNRRSAEEQRTQRLWRAVLDGLIERNLLASEARKLGYHVDEQQVMDRLASEETVRLSLGVDSPIPGGEVPVQVRDEDGRFDPDSARRLIQNYLRRHVGEFTLAQMEEELAERMRQTIRASVTVSDQEVWEGYVRERDSARIKYVHFKASFYRDNLDPTDDELRAWIADNTEAVDEAYERNERRYTDLDPQVRARHILFEAAADDEAARAEAQAKADAALARIRGGEDFSAVAEDVSEDSSTARRGGDLGYRPRGRNAAEFDDVAFEMEIGAISDVVSTPLGLHIIELVGKREGDVPLDEAKLELSRDLYIDAQSKVLAEQAAAQALEGLRSGVDIDELDAWMGRRERGEAEPVALEDLALGEEEELEAPEVPERAPDAPSVTESSSFSRTGRPIAGVDSSELVRDVFARTLEDALPEAPIELGTTYVVYRLTEREEATREEFEDGVSDRIREGLLLSKQREAVELFVRNLRNEADAAGRIRLTMHDLQVVVEGDGVVRSDPAGIQCGQDCNALFEFGNMVQLIAEPGPGARFLGWTGACSGSGETCVVTLAENQSVTARFRGGSSGGSSESSSSSSSSEESESSEGEDEAASE